MLLLLYNLLLIPFLFPYLAWRLLVRGKSWEGLGERFGRVPALGPAPPGGRVWVHAVSVGETVAATPVVHALRAALPECEILLSTVTPTGQAQARRALPDVTHHLYLPFDLPGVVDQVFTRLQPSALVLMEAEIWPNLLCAARRRGVPVVVANGHISDRTFRRAAPLRELLAPILAGITRYLAQSALIRERALRLGMPAGRSVVAGHTKFDQDVPPLGKDEVRSLRSSLGLEEGQPLFLAGSTHEGEEELILNAWEAARAHSPSLALMIAPRHLQRVCALRALIEQRGLNVRLRSAPGEPFSESPDAQRPERPSPVLLLDTMGELARFYGLASVAFVGGSLAPKGGHDILQPLFHGVPTLFGPHMHNQRALAALALGAGAARQVNDEPALVSALISLLTDHEVREAMIAAGARLLSDNRGASARCAAEVESLLRQGGEPADARRPLTAAGGGP
jgi:3-deoxy-D-manno-octulosonic-acid transferase